MQAERDVLNEAPAAELARASEEETEKRLEDLTGGEPGLVSARSTTGIAYSCDPVGCKHRR